MSVGRIICARHVELLEIIGVLTLRDVVGGQEGCTALEGLEPGIPTLLTRIGKTIDDALLLGRTACFDVVIIIEILVSRICT